MFCIAFFGCSNNEDQWYISALSQTDHENEITATNDQVRTLEVPETSIHEGNLSEMLQIHRVIEKIINDWIFNPDYFSLIGSIMETSEHLYFTFTKGGQVLNAFHHKQQNRTHYFRNLQNDITGTVVPLPLNADERGNIYFADVLFWSGNIFINRLYAKNLRTGMWPFRLLRKSLNKAYENEGEHFSDQPDRNAWLKK